VRFHDRSGHPWGLHGEVNVTGERGDGDLGGGQSGDGRGVARERDAQILAVRQSGRANRARPADSRPIHHGGKRVGQKGRRVVLVPPCLAWVGVPVGVHKRAQRRLDTLLGALQALHTAEGKGSARDALRWAVLLLDVIVEAGAGAVRPLAEDDPLPVCRRMGVGHKLLVLQDLRIAWQARRIDKALSVAEGGVETRVALGALGARNATVGLGIGDAQVSKRAHKAGARVEAGPPIVGHTGHAYHVVHKWRAAVGARACRNSVEPLGAEGPAMGPIASTITYGHCARRGGHAWGACRPQPLSVADGLVEKHSDGTPRPIGKDTATRQAALGPKVATVALVLAGLIPSQEPRVRQGGAVLANVQASVPRHALRRRDYGKVA